MTSGAPAPPSRWRITSGERDPGTVERLLRLLPGWFGIESAVAGYVRGAHELPTYLAWPAGDVPAGREPAGVLFAARHFPWSAEIHLIAVDPAVHRRGAGRALVQALEAGLAVDGPELLQVKTLGPSHPDPGYRRTRLFYEGMGFRPLEEIHGLWPGNPCLIMVKAVGHAPHPPRTVSRIPATVTADSPAMTGPRGTYSSTR